MHHSKPLLVLLLSALLALAPASFVSAQSDDIDEVDSIEEPGGDAMDDDDDDFDDDDFDDLDEDLGSVEESELPPALSVNLNTTFDLILVRPIMVAMMAASGLTYGIAAPHTAIFNPDGLKELGDNLLRNPYRFTFRRPLGSSSDDWNPNQ